MRLKIIIFIMLIGSLFSCKKFITIDPPRDQITSTVVYSNDATAIAVIRGIYSQMTNGNFASGGASSITLLSGLSADELTNYQTNADYIAFYTNTLNSTNSLSMNLWAEPYQYINNANAAIEGLMNSTGVTLSTKNELIGEAKFIRAFCHFYLVNLFGDVPLILTTDYTKNAIASRTPQFQLYKQIISDLIDAQNSLASDFSFSNGERDQPNKWAATALLARVYLYTGDWVNAALQAESVINNSGIFALDSDLNSVFLKNSTETIWQLKPIGGTINTNEGSIFIPVSTPLYAALSNQLLNSFELNDNRKIKWINNLTVGNTTYYYPFKYKIRQNSSLSEYSMVLRLAEQYLIHAEARAQQNDISGAQADLNIIRNRAGLPNTSASTQSTILTAVLHERQVEFFAEWGHRWLDLKRTANVDAVMGIVTQQKGGSWNAYWQWYPISQSDILNDKNIIQNLGY